MWAEPKSLSSMMTRRNVRLLLVSLATSGDKEHGQWLPRGSADINRISSQVAAANFKVTFYTINRHAAL